MDLLPHIKFSRDEAGNRIYHGRRATYRVVDMQGPRMVEVHPAEGFQDDGSRDERFDALLVKLNECKAYIDTFEDTGYTDLAWAAAMTARQVKG